MAPDVDPVALAALRSYHVLDTEAEVAYDDIARLAAAVCGAPQAAIAFRDAGRWWCKARAGSLPQVWPPGGPGVPGDGWVPVTTPDGVVVGQLAVFGRGGRLSRDELDLLAAMARVVTTLLELGRPSQSAGILVLDSAANVRYATPALERLLGRDIRDHVGTSVLEYIHPDDVSRALEALERATSFGGDMLPMDVRVAHADGSWRLVEVLAENRLDDPAIASMVFTISDASTRSRSDALVAGEALVLELIGRGAPLEQTLLAIAELLEDQIPDARCCVTVADEAERELSAVAAPTLDPAVVARHLRLPIGPDASPSGETAFRRHGVVVTDIVTNPRCEHVHDLAAAHRLAACWANPIVSTSDRRALGAVTSYHATSGRPRPEQAHIQELCANLAAVAIERHRAEAALLHHATHDALTGLPNRTLFLDRLDHALERCEGTLAVLFLDVDQFKLVNDSLGHVAGDHLLVALAERMRTVLPRTCTVARFGGDEFTVLCEDVQDPRDAVVVGESLMQAFLRPLQVGDGEVIVTLSIGIALPTRAGESAHTLLRDADAAMYRAKARGRNRIELFDTAMRTAVVERLEMERALHRAMARHELRLHFQPEVRIADGCVVGTEALLRWERSGVGLVPPDVFVPVAEEIGLIVPIGEWVLAEACRQAARWTRDHPELVVWVNVSPVQLARDDFPDRVDGIIRASGVAHDRIGLEITEGALMQDADAAVLTLRRLRRLGVHLAIDDFGTGYSSLGYLKRFPVEIVKIDRSFVAGLGVDDDDTSIVTAVVQLAHAIGRRVVAEGVETRAQLEHLRGLGCDDAQGYFLARPAPATTGLPDVLAG
ncbi:MAG TPA: bifunctional diguanylate cyclase/phosphodiesterase [Acidimicrobiia bacterium]|jgi:diguanylate cyclase (GGDEF)-like protein/PAS domain S-box-containing protein